MHNIVFVEENAFLFLFGSLEEKFIDMPLLRNFSSRFHFDMLSKKIKM
jgi:hypothetical protein